MADIAQIEFSNLLKDRTGNFFDPAAFEYIAVGASGRSIMRGQGYLGVYWTADRADNGSFVPVAHYLAEHGLHVPEIFAHRDLTDGSGIASMEDLGSCSLLDLKDEPWEKRSVFYRAALDELHALHSLPLPQDFDLQVPFDESLYRWEQEYFAEHYWSRHRGFSAEKFLALPELAEIARDLAALPACLVHRDFQSQNVMIYKDRAYLIDFQGMRLGRAEYDLASLIFDPYADLNRAQCDELFQYWEKITGAPLDHKVFFASALQRLMQAMGAFGNIGYNQGKTWYLELFPAAGRALCELNERYPSHPVLTKILS